MPVGRRVDLNKMSLKKDLTVTPFMPGAPVPIHYTLYKLTNKFMYIPRYFSEDGDLILNELNKVDIKTEFKPRDYQEDVIQEIYSELLKNGSCIACLYTGWGKTFASLYLSHLL